MLFDEGTQVRLNTPNPVVQESIAQWNRKKEEANLKKLQEQRETRELLDKYWPWGTGGAKPRGLRNLRLEGIFPNSDFVKNQAKRLVSPLGLGRPGGGAPMVTNSGRKAVRTREDPIIRYQWSKDLRKCVDNSLRYKLEKEEREAYKKQLDAQVAERKLREKKEKYDDLVFHQKSFLKTPPWGKPGPGGTIWRPPRTIGVNFLKSLGWSTENTLKALTEEYDNYRDTVRKKYEDFKQLSLQQPNRISRNERTIIPRTQIQEPRKIPCQFSPGICSPVEKRKLSPLNREKVNGEELVPLLAKQRAVPVKIPLSTTDVTRGNPEQRTGNPDYLQQLTNQVDSRNQRLQEMKVDEIEMVRRHFVTLDGFWGRPGHGAPRSIIKKGCLDSLLYGHSICVN